MRESTYRRWIVPALIALAVSTISIDSRSLWVDELGTWGITQHRSIHEWTQAFLWFPNSDGQLFFYHLFMYLWVSTFGDSELALRWTNYLFLTVLFAGVARLRTSSQELTVLFLSIASSGFLIYYVNEARPYILYLAGSVWIAVSIRNLVACDHNEVRNTAEEARGLFFGSILLTSGNVIGYAWLACTLLALGAIYPRQARRLIGGSISQPYLLACTVSLLLIGLSVALHSYWIGARPNQAGGFTFSGLAYGFVELLGVAGLGPSRSDLRTDWQSADITRLAYMFLAACVLAGALVWRCWRFRNERLTVLTVTVSGVGVLAMIMLGFILHWRVVGRHLAPLWAPYILVVGSFVNERIGRSVRFRTTVFAAGMFALPLLSAINFRTGAEHRNDDFRGAGARAAAEVNKGQSVLWIAAPEGIRYYALPSVQLPMNGELIGSQNRSVSDMEGDSPSVVITSTRADYMQIAEKLVNTDRYVLADSLKNFSVYKKALGQ